VRVLEIIVGLLLQIPIAIVATSLASRMLGVRRSWVAIGIAGTIGWVCGNLVALALSDWDWDAATLSVPVVVLSGIFTMIAAIALDFLARPGTLARGERAGLLVMPRPMHDIRRRLEPYARYRQILEIARRNGLAVPGLARPSHAAERPDLGVALRKTLEECGVAFIKLGQMASTRVDLLPKALCDELAKLQADVAPEPREVMQAQLEAELGRPVDELFAEFDWTPIGSASIAQAYAARRTSSEAVVVKVQRPGIDELVERDIAALMHIATAAENRTPQGKDLHVTVVAQEFATNLRNELDFVREAANAIDIAEATNPDSGVRVPRIHRDLLTKRVMVQERFDGPSVSTSQRLDELAVDRQQLSDRLVHTVAMHMFSHGHYHSDPHPGNVLILADGTLGLIDFGSTGRLDPRQRTALLEMTAAVMRSDSASLLDAIEEVAHVGSNARDGGLQRALDHLMSEHVRPGQAIDIQVLNEILPLLATYDIQMPGAFSVVMRALVLLDGTARVIDPNYSLLDGVNRMIASGADTAPVEGTVQEQLIHELMQEMPRLRRLPAHVDRIASLASRGELRHQVALFATEDDARVISTLVNRVVLAMLGGLLFAGSALLISIDEGGMLGNTPITRVFGYIGLGVAVTLVLRVIAAIIREGYN
jgi:ubiquinone biosynthesis protein